MTWRSNLFTFKLLPAAQEQTYPSLFLINLIKYFKKKIYVHIDELPLGGLLYKL